MQPCLELPEHVGGKIGPDSIDLSLRILAYKHFYRGW